MRWPDYVELVEVGPRDGLQNLDRCYPIEIKVEMVRLLVEAGLDRIEVTSFGRPEAVPQLADAEDLLSRLPRTACIYRGLVPNRRGAERAAAAGVDEMLALVTASDAYTRRNQGMSLEQALGQLEEVAAVGQREGVPVTLALGAALFCPYEGEICPDQVLAIVDRAWEAGVEELYLATSVGVDAPRPLASLCETVAERHPMRIGVHLHNANGMALANAVAAIDAGASFLEGSICGIGGGLHLPDRRVSAGNVATEDLIQMLDECGVETGTDFERILHAAEEIERLLELDAPSSSALLGGTRKASMFPGA